MANKGSNKPLAAIYAQALYEAARDANAQLQAAAELLALKEMLRKDRRIGIFLETPTISFDDKRKVIQAAFKSFSPITRNFLLVIAERSRAAMLDQIVDAYNEYATKIAGIATVEVRTARKLDDSERASVSKLMEAKLKKKIQLKEEVVPQLIGGMVLQHEDTLWDGSLRHKLNEAVHRMELSPAHVLSWSDRAASEELDEPLASGLREQIK
ncbi:MAG TPA: ATP synthase F1 subunit delta [Planctomycetota bacterium]|nr:ATP synthase F1 subunit delta [Planctomycetota bacterium]